LRGKLSVTTLAFVAATAGIFAAQVLPQSSARANTTGVRECIGSNRGDWDAFHKAVPHSHCVRTYFDQVNVFPTTWPTSAGQGTWQLLSIRPGYSDLMSGSLDAQIHSLCASAPPHSRLTIYQENAGANPLQYPPSVHNAAHYVAMQKRMETLCKGTPARFGVLIIAPYGTVLKWIYKGDDWFGYDLFAFDRYLNPNKTINADAVTERMTNNLRTLQKFTGKRYPPIVLGETNASRDFQRKTWFSVITSWFASHDGHRMGWVLTRWTARTGPHTGLSGRWPPSAQVVAALRHLAWLYQ
jgi:hypothetical protein